MKADFLFAMFLIAIAFLLVGTIIGVSLAGSLLAAAGAELVFVGAYGLARRGK